MYNAHMQYWVSGGLLYDDYFSKAVTAQHYSASVSNWYEQATPCCGASFICHAAIRLACSATPPESDLHQLGQHPHRVHLGQIHRQTGPVYHHPVELQP